ncbi:MAG: hypothetical protein ACK5L5_12715 [Bacteroidales bacterium]
MEKANIRRKTQAGSDAMKHQAHLEMINKELVSLKELLLREDNERKQLLNSIITLEKRNESNLKKTIASFNDMANEVSSFKELIHPLFTEFVGNIEAQNRKHRNSMIATVGWIVWLFVYALFFLSCVVAKLLIG